MATRDELSGTLFFGDNLDVLRDNFDDESVDLIYLDPPFNSNADYNVLFADESGAAPPSQVWAYGDTWHWGEDSERALRSLLTDDSPSPAAGNLLDALINALGTNQMTAYLSMMAIRLADLRRVLRPTGSIYLHCDPTASHYLKLLMDAVFGAKNYRNELIWHYRGAALTSAKKVYPRKHDTLLFYSKGDSWTFNVPREDEISLSMTERWGDYLERDGRTVLYGSIKHEGKEESRSRARIERREGRPPRDDDVAFIVNPSRVRSVWTDVPEVRQNSRYREWMGYPTQKPLRLLQRIIETSSNKGDLVLDPFCGCGTAVVAAQQLGRSWAGIDITHLAIGMVEDRLGDLGVMPEVMGVPKDLASARELARRSRFQFETWAVTRLDGFRPNQGQVGDGGIDGEMRFAKPNGKGRRNWETGKAVAQSKSGNVGVGDLRAFIASMRQANADLGVFIMMDPPGRGSTIPQTAAREGFTKIGDREYPTVQVWTMADYFNGRAPELPIPLGREQRRMI